MVTTEALRIVFFGTPQFAVPTLEALLGSRHRVVGVVTQPDRPKGRGQETSHGPIKALAIEAGLPVFQPERLRDTGFLRDLAALDPDLGVVAAYGKILTESMLSAPRLGMLNVHASLLPKYRGAAPVHRAVIAGERETGVTIMRVVRALDAGPMLATVVRPIGLDDTSEQVEHDLARMGAELLARIVDAIAEGPVTETPQDDGLATYAHRLSKQDGVVDWSAPARDIHNLIRGLHPWPHAFTYLDGKRYILLRSSVSSSDEAADKPDAAGEHGEPGRVREASGDRLEIATGAGGAIRIEEIQAEGRRPMNVREFLAGHPIQRGDWFRPLP